MVLRIFRIVAGIVVKVQLICIVILIFGLVLFELLVQSQLLNIR